MIEINKDVVFVQGFHSGAIYNFNSGNVYSVNKDSCKVINDYIAGDFLSDEARQYIELLVSNDLLCEKFNYKKYIPKPTSAKLDLCWLEITQQCNCRCVHCYEGNTHIKCKDALSLSEWKNVIEQIKDCGVKRVVIIGGEPCIHPEIDEIAKSVSSANINVTIFTNGTYITESLKNIIISNNIKMKFSLYGHCSDVHDNITKKQGSFNKLVENIKFFISKNVQVDVAVVIMRENEEYYNDIIEFLKSLGVKRYRIDVIRETFCNNTSIHMPTKTDVINSVKRTQPVFSKISKEKFDNAFYCNTCWNGKLVVCEDGTVLPCVFARNISLGNIRNKQISDIIFSKETSKCWGLSFDHIKDCCNCEFRFACKDCRPLAEAANEYYAKNPRCTYNVYNGEWK